MIKTIYLDLDGVIYDFMGRICALEGFNNIDHWYEHIKNLQHTFQEYVGEAMLKYRMNSLYSHGDILPDGEQLLTKLLEYKNKYDFKLVILSALYGTMDHYCETSSVRISYDKLFWLQNTKLNGKSIYDLVDKIELVPTWKDKIHHATDDSILIDDYVGTKMLFDQANMKFIHFKDYQQTISELESHLSGEVK